MKIISLLIIAFALANNILAQGEAPELITDRPDQTESSKTVPHKSLQIETGFVKENIDNIDAFAYNTTLLRYGLLHNFELRLGLEYLGEDNKSLNTKDRGLSPLYVGFKTQIRDEDGWKPEVALLGGLVLPFTAVEAFKPNDVAANARFSLSHTLSDRFSIGYNLGVEWDGVSTIPTYYYSVALGISLMDKLGMYVETYGLLIENDNSEYLADTGFTYLILPNLQADISAGTGLNDNALNGYISVGITYRLPQ